VGHDASVETIMDEVGGRGVVAWVGDWLHHHPQEVPLQAALHISRPRAC
jgi:hypothetical protein